MSILPMMKLVGGISTGEDHAGLIKTIGQGAHASYSKQINLSGLQVRENT
jgi:hypothetical protein